MAGPTLLIGSSGMLGSAFRSHLPKSNLVLLDRFALSVQEPTKLLSTVSEISPSLIINCAADTNVEAAEQSPAAGFAANALLPGILAQAARDADALLVHFSSTGCYGGNSTAPHSDFEQLNPASAHHRSKAAGEAEVRDAACRHLILRLGWLYGGTVEHKKNFVMARIKEARGSEPMSSDPYQTGSPTYVDDVVRQTSMLIEANLTGTFNCVATGAVTRYDYVARILLLAGLDKRLTPKRFARKAPVAANEAAVNDKLTLLSLNKMPEWDVSLASYIQTLLAAEKNA